MWLKGILVSEWESMCLRGTHVARGHPYAHMAEGDSRG